LAVLGSVDQKLFGMDVRLFTFGAPRVGDINFANFVNSIMTNGNLRGVYRNDPVPTVPYEEVLTFFHSGTEIHFLDCVNSYLVYPQFTDDSPMSEFR
jgi:predicted lipase